MSLTNPEKVVTEERLSEFYTSILPYLGGEGGGVSSVNGKTGTVVLDGTDIILASALPIGGVSQTTAEGALGALNDKKLDTSYYAQTGAHNYFYWKEAINKKNGYTQSSVNADGSEITLTTTTQSSSANNIFLSMELLENATYRMMGRIEPGAGKVGRVQVWNNGTSTKIGDSGEASTNTDFDFTFNTGQYPKITVGLLGAHPTGTIVYRNVMIALADDPNSAVYSPMSLSNQMLSRAVVPRAGYKNQVLGKLSLTDYDIGWIDVPIGRVYDTQTWEEM